MNSVSEANCSHAVIPKRKFRKTNDFIVEEITDGDNIHKSHKKKRARHSFMPLIDDVKLTSCLLSNTSKQLSLHKTKALNNLKLHKQKLESRRIDQTPDNRIQRLKLKKAKGVWTPVKNDESMKREVYVRLIPLEKTNLLTDKQRMQLIGNKFGRSLSDFHRPCRVILNQLTPEEISYVSNRNDTVSNGIFSPGATSSPNFFNKSDFPSTIMKTLFVKTGTNLGEINNSLLNVSKSSDGIIDLNSTYEVNEPLLKTPINGVTKQVTWRNLSLDATNNENINHSPHATYEIDQIQDQKKTPKSVLKSNSRTPTNNNRRVTFNDTSIIIIHDSDTLYTSSTPTHFTKDYDVARKTPGNISVLKNANGRHKRELTENVTYRKKTPMPDFAKIHKRMFNKMLDIKQHTEEKLKRSHILLSGGKPKKRLNDHIHGVTNQLKKQNAKIDQLTVEKKDTKDKNKTALFHREQVIAIANKVRPKDRSSTEDNRVYVKGVRSNRRFELLMNLRKSQKQKK
ncbi:hypothetical protein RN001_000283 [Aquatica leii]|uniref:Uncharacterized protein n=1 Tax=Aquatica leii TaxID=1421715 RepID=A0AAN7SJ39_9COLE|nr:hypothetical protein RN001_000283 [Aquatica leii]